MYWTTAFALRVINNLNGNSITHFLEYYPTDHRNYSPLFEHILNIESKQLIRESRKEKKQ